MTVSISNTSTKVYSPPINKSIQTLECAEAVDVWLQSVWSRNPAFEPWKKNDLIQAWQQLALHLSDGQEVYVNNRPVNKQNCLTAINDCALKHLALCARKVQRDPRYAEAWKELSEVLSDDQIVSIHGSSMTKQDCLDQCDNSWVL